MNKLVIGILGVSILMGALMVTNRQGKTIKIQKTSIAKQIGQISQLSNSLKQQLKENEALEEENFMLEEHSGSLRDSVMKLQDKVTFLENENLKREKYLALVQKKLNLLNGQSEQIQLALRSERRNNVVDPSEMKYLTDQHTELTHQIQKYKSKEKWAQNELRKSSIVDAQYGNVTPDLFQGADFDFLATKVEVVSYELRKKRFGRNLKRVKKGVDWRYTLIDVNIDSPRLQNMMGKSFKLKLVDTDNQEVLSYVESNPHFPNSTLDSKGVGFTYSGKSINLVYYNNDDKKSDNFELQFFFVDDHGSEHIIPGATRQIVKDGKVL